MKTLFWIKVLVNLATVACLGLIVFSRAAVAQSSFVLSSTESINQSAQGYEESIINRETHEVDIDKLSKVLLITDQYKFNLENYIPLRGLPTNAEGDEVAQRILRHSMQKFLDDYKDRNDTVVAPIARANQSMNTNFGSSSHRFRARFRPIEGEAEAIYSGPIPVQTRLKYDAYENETRFEIFKVYNSKTYSCTYANGSNQSSTVVSVRWGF